MSSGLTVPLKGRAFPDQRFGARVETGAVPSFYAAVQIGDIGGAGPLQDRQQHCRHGAALIIHHDMVCGGDPLAAENFCHFLMVYEREGLLRVGAGTQAARHWVKRDGAFDMPLVVGSSGRGRR